MLSKNNKKCCLWKIFIIFLRSFNPFSHGWLARWLRQYVNEHCLSLIFSFFFFFATKNILGVKKKKKKWKAFKSIKMDISTNFDDVVSMKFHLLSTHVEPKCDQNENIICLCTIVVDVYILQACKQLNILSTDRIVCNIFIAVD